ncbi:hypothetical protein CVT25_002435 [Psilocybe cyanescens]|uniref:Uncharacterized protein n=1 Tax=Psilocybe cyanescens TaxID=93625 RepID=A0A409WK42_PSICY|nr:hypothetical protein CVT25_002435 [Psilocybe cyanescens]
MSTPEIPISVDVQRGIINASVNAAMLLNFLMGRSSIYSEHHCLKLTIGIYDFIKVVITVPTDMEMLPCLGTVVRGNPVPPDSFRWGTR